MSAIGVVMPVFFNGSNRIEEVHCTLIYLGESGEVAISRPILDAAVDRLRAQCKQPLMVKVRQLAVYGHGTHTVLELEDITLKSYRTFLERELRRDGIISASQYAYSPHVTLNKHTASKTPILPWPDFRAPEYVWIDRPTIWWKSEDSK
jgi:2'-5' RNA ligase